MKNILFIFAVALITIFTACKKETSTSTNTNSSSTSANSFNKSYNAQWSAGILKDLQCNVTITGSSTRLIRVITTSPQIDTMNINGTYNSSLNTITIMPCDSCFQGFNHKMFGIRSGGFSEFRNGKLYVQLNYYSAPDTVFISSFVLTEL